MDSNFQIKANEWLRPPFDIKTQQEVRAFSKKELESAFCQDLSFGTGGIRAIMGVGTSRLNIYTIRKITLGLAKFLKKKHQNKTISVVIGFDSRHHSKEFAEEAAKTLSSQGINSYVTFELRPTPYVSFAVRHLNAQAGIMITASHNPKEYNGYKVYGEDGGQLVFPDDLAVMQEIESINSFDLPAPIGFIQEINLDDAYINAFAFLNHFPTLNQTDGNQIKIIYTPLHGTGITLADKALKSFGFTNIELVEKQSIPNGDFPTVAKPNPEYREALKLGIDLLYEKKGDLLLATDPDADRISAAIIHEHDVVVFTGNELACLLIYYLCKVHPISNNSAVVTTIVSTPLIKKICLAHKIACIEVLTGFKFIAEKIKQWENSSYHFLFGAEESCGYLAGTYTRDKDAISTCCLVAEMVLFLKKQKKNLSDFLKEIYEKYGVFKESVEIISFAPTQEGINSIATIMNGIRKNPPQTILGNAVTAIQDYLNPSSLPKADVLTIHLSNIRVIIRPSGTEPIIKIYGSIQGDLSTLKEVLSKVKEILLSHSTSI